MIRFDNWKLHKNGAPLAMQHDHLSRELKISGAIPAGYHWAALIQTGEYLDIISLSETEDGLSVLLTSAQLAFSGYYHIQLRATRGEEVRHTNTISVYVSDSLSGDAHWPTLPSEFSQVERTVLQAAENAEQSARRAENATVMVPVVQDGTWWTYDQALGAYADTGLPAQGAQGENGQPDLRLLEGDTLALNLPNHTEIRCTQPVRSLSILGFDAPAINKSGLWSIQFQAAETVTVNIAETVLWSIAEPVFSGGSSYWLTFAAFGDHYLGVWTAHE